MRQAFMVYSECSLFSHVGIVHHVQQSLENRYVSHLPIRDMRQDLSIAKQSKHASSSQWSCLVSTSKNSLPGQASLC